MRQTKIYYNFGIIIPLVFRGHPMVKNVINISMVTYIVHFTDLYDSPGSLLWTTGGSSKSKNAQIDLN